MYSSCCAEMFFSLFWVDFINQIQTPKVKELILLLPTATNIAEIGKLNVHQTPRNTEMSSSSMIFSP